LYSVNIASIITVLIKSKDNKFLTIQEFGQKLLASLAVNYWDVWPNIVHSQDRDMNSILPMIIGFRGLDVLILYLIQTFGHPYRRRTEGPKPLFIVDILTQRQGIIGQFEVFLGIWPTYRSEIRINWRLFMEISDVVVFRNVPGVVVFRVGAVITYIAIFEENRIFRIWFI